MPKAVRNRSRAIALAQPAPFNLGLRALILAGMAAALAVAQLVVQ
jgi:hypothetical protein